ncbi:MAG: uracil-DNA glycosylase [Leptothrix sp. (in: b-proteobacteria)]
MPDNRLKRPLAEVLADVPPAWSAVTQAFAASARGAALCRQIDARVAQGAEVYPVEPLRALQALTPPQVRVVILGQDPYHGPGEAEGLAFSVAPGVKIPPSLRNIRKELADDLGLALPASGSLLAWCRAGVLLLNTSLTVERDRPASHAKLGWEQLTDCLIDLVAAQPQPKVFMLWGAHAQSKAARVQSCGRPHLLLQSNHPSPLSARRPPVPFLGSRPFSRANQWLLAAGAEPIDWMLAGA